MNVDSELRKYFVTSLREKHPIFDKRQGTFKQNTCYLISSQSKDVVDSTKCGQHFDCTIEIECISRTEVSGNAVSTLILDEMENFVLQAYNSINLTNFTTTTKTYNSQSFDAEVSADKTNRKVILMNFKIQ